MPSRTQSSVAPLAAARAPGQAAMASASTAAAAPSLFGVGAWPRQTEHLVVGRASPRREPWRRDTVAAHMLAEDWVHACLDGRSSNRIWLLSASMHKLLYEGPPPLKTATWPQRRHRAPIALLEGNRLAVEALVALSRALEHPHAVHAIRRSLRHAAAGLCAGGEERGP